jgi:[ribosomal protein S18]-alanine N-acetyltransferase
MSLAGSFHIRSMAESDLDAVVALDRESASAPHWSRADYLVAIQGDSGVNLTRFGLVAEVGGEVAGFAVVRLITASDVGEAELESIVIAPQWRGLGLGASLLSELTHRASAQGARRLDLEVRASNSPAIRLYQRAGFREIGRRPGYYHDPEEDAVLMSVIW